MTRKAWLAPIAVVVVLLVAAIWLDPNGRIVGWLKGEHFYSGRPTSVWSQALLSDDSAERTQARTALAQGGVGAVDVLMELLQYQDGSPWQAAEVRWNAAEILGELGAAAAPASETLLAALQDSDPHVRSVAAVSLPMVDTPADQAVPALTELLGTEVSISAARALSQYGSDAEAALPKLVELLSDRQRDSEVRWNAARTLGKLGEAGAEAVPVLVAHLKDETATVREHSAEALGDIGAPAISAVPDLVGVLDDPATRVRRDAVRSLGYFGPPAKSALPAIKPLFDDPEEIVRDAARTAWKSISGQDPE